MAKENEKSVRNAAYIGRFISMGEAESTGKFFQIYCTMGRSALSQARMLVEENGIVKTVPKGERPSAAESKALDHLLIYTIAGRYEDHHVVSNGEQTDTILDFLATGKSFEEAVYLWNQEDDKPIYTPRIAGMATALRNGRVEYRFAVNKMFWGDVHSSIVDVYHYKATIPGYGLFIHTYDRDELCKAYDGKPYWMHMYDTIEDNVRYYWGLVHEELRVGMYVKAIDMDTGEVEARIINKEDCI